MRSTGSARITRWPSARRPRRYWSTAQVAPPWCGSPATMPASRMLSRSTPSADSDLVEEAREDDVRVEVLARDGASGGRVRRVVRDDAIRGGGRVAHVAEADEALTEWVS